MTYAAFSYQFYATISICQNICSCEPGTSGRAGKYLLLVLIRSCGRVVILFCDDHACAGEILHDDV